jgi:hypothetical protein
MNIKISLALIVGLLAGLGQFHFAHVQSGGSRAEVQEMFANISRQTKYNFGERGSVVIAEGLMLEC